VVPKLNIMNLGAKVKDKITGFEGITTGKASYITGCDQFLVQPPVKNGDFVEGRWFDIGRLDIIEKNVITEQSVQAEENGCDTSAPIK
jgi:hypothetical protein